MSEHFNEMETTMASEGGRYAGAAVAPSKSQRAASKRRPPKSEYELYMEAMKKAQSLKAKLIERRSKNRESFVEDLYGQFKIAEIEGDLDESDRLMALRSVIHGGRGQDSVERG